MGDEGPRKRKRTALVANVVIVVGALIVLGAVAAYALGLYRETRFAQEAAAIQTRLFPDRSDDADETVPTLQLRALSGQLKFGETGKESSPPIRILIPSVGIDSLVVETGLKDGDWQVPKFVVGHLEGTANPGEKGNMAMSGHVSSVNSGNVFAKLDQVKVGDDIYVFTKMGQMLYRTNQVTVVANDDVSVLDATPQPTLTLITCTGAWNPVARDYTQRFIVKGIIFQDSPPENPSIRAR